MSDPMIQEYVSLRRAAAAHSRNREYREAQIAIHIAAQYWASMTSEERREAERLFAMQEEEYNPETEEEL